MRSSLSGTSRPVPLSVLGGAVFRRRDTSSPAAGPPSGVLIPAPAPVVPAPVPAAPAQPSRWRRAGSALGKVGLTALELGADAVSAKILPVAVARIVASVLRRMAATPPDNSKERRLIVRGGAKMISQGGRKAFVILPEVKVRQSLNGWLRHGDIKKLNNSLLRAMRVRKK